MLGLLSPPTSGSVPSGNVSASIGGSDLLRDLFLEGLGPHKRPLKRLPGLGGPIGSPGPLISGTFGGFWWVNEEDTATADGNRSDDCGALPS